MQNGNDLVKMKDVRHLRMVAVNTKEETPGNPRRNVNRFTSTGPDMRGFLYVTSPGLLRRQFRS
jgi:hypothetical protein